MRSPSTSSSATRASIREECPAAALEECSCVPGGESEGGGGVGVEVGAAGMHGRVGGQVVFEDAPAVERRDRGQAAGDGGRGQA